MSYELSPRTDALQDFLAGQGWIQEGERVLDAERAGEGNMNRTLRARTGRRTLILKQSCNYCAKFPEIPAPIERIETEVEFYRVAARSTELAARMPKVLAFAPEHHLALLEDLGAAQGTFLDGTSTPLAALERVRLKEGASVAFAADPRRYVYRSGAAPAEPNHHSQLTRRGCRAAASTAATRRAARRRRRARRAQSRQRRRRRRGWR